MNKFKSMIKERMASLRSDENGMEAAQVILILVVVVLVLLPIIVKLAKGLSSKGDSTSNDITGFSGK